MSHVLPRVREISHDRAQTIGGAVAAFLDVAMTSTGRATFYNSRAEQQDAELAAHLALLNLDRGLYAAMLCLPGTTDRVRMVGIHMLLRDPRAGRPSAILDESFELALLQHIATLLPPPRVLRTFVQLRTDRVNNARARKLILRYILGSPRLNLWAIRYRNKLRQALRHAWGQRVTGAVYAAVGDVASHGSSQRSCEIVDRHVAPYADFESRPAPSSVEFYGSLHYILGGEPHPTFRSKQLQAVYDARTDLAAGAILGPEILEGIRSTFHADTPHAKIVEICAGARAHTRGQRLTDQKKAEAAGVELEVDFSQYDATRLYLHAFENGLSPDIEAALSHRAYRAAQGLPMSYERALVVLDGSQSQQGDDTQRLRPIATTLALRDLLRVACADAQLVWCGGNAVQVKDRASGLVYPEGDTALGLALAKGLADCGDGEASPQAIFVVTDGYENAPAGRFAEVLAEARRLGCTAPVYQLTPVLAAETQSVRPLVAAGSGVDTGVAVMPIFKPEGFGMGLARAALATDPHQALSALVHMALPAPKEAS